jgi:hypothetical protein
VLVLGITCAGGQSKKATSGAQTKAQPQQQSNTNSPDQMLKLALFYYNNDDITDKAATQLRAVIAKYPGANEAETAQYYLGSYFQRKYYIEMAKYRKEDKAALEAAKREYRIYTDRYYKSGTHQWLADAFFNLALVFMQQGDDKNPGYELSKMSGAAALDSLVYIYQVAYSQSTDDVIDNSFQTRSLAEYASTVAGNSGQSFAQKVASIKQWCRSQGAKQAS